MNGKFPLETFPPRRQWPEMPPKIVSLMYTTISTADTICFALTCKFTLALYLTILEKLGRTMPVTPQPPMFLGIKSFPWIRIHLLRRLQNSRWKFCEQCWILHPRSIWNIQRFWRLDHKKCSYGCNTLGSRKCYLPYADEVHMFPCSTLTIHHKLQLISLCRQQPLDSKGGVQPLTNRSCSCEMLLHTCTFDEHPIAQVQISVSFSLGCRDQRLRLRTRFLFDFTKSTPSQLEDFWNKRGDICVRENTGEWVGKFFREAVNPFGMRMDWTPCGWFSWDVSDEGPLEIALNRNLGKREWPSKSWIRNCSKPS